MENTVVPPNAYVTYKDKKLFICRHPTLGLPVGSGGGGGYFGEGHSHPQSLTTFWYKLGRGKYNLYP